MLTFRRDIHVQNIADMNNLHIKLKLKYLSERRKMFMLKLLFKLSQDMQNVNRYRPERVLRTVPKVKMKIAFTDKERVMRSPYYVCIYPTLGQA